jgi:Na+/melibiose symporter-like transporter
VLLAAAFYGLWLPPVGLTNLSYWLALMLVLAYMAHSMLNIAYLSWGARIANRNSSSLLGAAAWREGAGLIGVIAASVIPSLIFSGKQIAADLGWYSLLFALLLLIAIVALLTGAPRWQRNKPERPVDLAQQWQLLRSNHAFRSLLVPYFINAISVAIPATLVVFFINDRLQSPAYVPAFLATYFIAAALGLPCWVQLATRIGVALCWRIGMVLAIVAFISAALLGAGQTLPFFVICAAAGFALGADLALPPVLLAQVISADLPPAAYYGIWTLLAKFALAISGLALPLLAALDYHPGHPAGAALAWVYAGIPCGLKCIAFILLMRNETTLSVRHA